VWRKTLTVPNISSSGGQMTAAFLLHSKFIDPSDSITGARLLSRFNIRKPSGVKTPASIRKPNPFLGWF
jgi:hypothetical protein